FHLHQLGDATSGVQGPAALRAADEPTTPTPVPRMPWRSRIARLWALGALILAPVAVWWLMRPPPPPDFRQLTFQPGRIGGARFGLQSVVYSLALPGRPLEVWQTGLDGSDPRSVGFANADLLGVLIGMLPQSEELALSLERHYVGGERFIGTLARARPGETPREVLSDVEDADWNPSGQQFAVARSSGVGGDSRLEYPIGHTIHSTRGSIHSVRISRDGQRVAFVEDRGGAGVGGRIVVASRDKLDILSDYWASARGIAW